MNNTQKHKYNAYKCQSFVYTEKSVHRTRKEKKSHGKIRQRTVAEVAMHSHVTSRECLSNQESPSVTMSFPELRRLRGLRRLPTHLSEAQGRASEDGQSHAPKSSAYHTSSLYCGKDEKETAIILSQRT